MIVVARDEPFRYYTAQDPTIRDGGLRPATDQRLLDTIGHELGHALSWKSSSEDAADTYCTHMIGRNARGLTLEQLRAMNPRDYNAVMGLIQQHQLARNPAGPGRGRSEEFRVVETSTPPLRAIE